MLAFVSLLCLYMYVFVDVCTYISICIVYPYGFRLFPPLPNSITLKHCKPNGKSPLKRPRLGNQGAWHPKSFVLWIDVNRNNVHSSKVYVNPSQAPTHPFVPQIQSYTAHKHAYTHRNKHMGFYICIRHLIMDVCVCETSQEILTSYSSNRITYSAMK